MQQRTAVGRAVDLDLGDLHRLETLDQHQVAGRHDGQLGGQVGLRSPRSSCISTQRWSETSRISLAPASRWRQESLPGLSTSKAWWVCLMTDTFQATAGDAGDHLFDQGGLARTGPAGETEYLHGVSVRGNRRK